MKNIINKVAAAMLVISSLFAINLAPITAPVSAQNRDEICEGLRRTGGDCGGGEASINRVITMVINTFSIVVGIVAVIMIIVGGFKYITSSGDSNNIASAKNTIIFAIVGLIIVALAQAIVAFVLDKTA